MPKPKVDIAFANGEIGSVTTSPDGICVIVASAVANGSFTLNKAETVYSLAEAEALGIIPTVAGNYELHKTVKEFYAEAGAGTELWIYGVAKTRTLDQIVTDSEAVLLASNRRVRFVICKYAPTTADTAITAGLRTGFHATCAAAQALAETYTTTKTQPVVFILEAYNFTGVAADLVGFSATNYNRVAVMIGDTERRTGTTTSKGAAVGVLGGRIAKNQVHVNVGRVKDGALKPLNFYVVDTPVEQVNVDAIYNKGFITLTTHVGKSGYYFVDDHLATAVDDDYHFLTRRRVVDKAFVLANTALTNFILDTVPVTNEGKIQTSYAKALEAEVERVIAQEMTAKGELSADVTNANSTGVEVIIDTTNNIVQDSTINGRIRVTPHGYGRFLEFTIGFNTGQ
jgi:hypothetical protein